MAGDGASLHMDKLGPHAGMQVVRKERGVWRVGRGWPSKLRAFEHVIVRKLKLQKHYTRVVVAREHAHMAASALQPSRSHGVSAGCVFLARYLKERARALARASG